LARVFIRPGFAIDPASGRFAHGQRATSGGLAETFL
jgi:hypothetical protein